jgi:hypothetical protein
LKRWRRGRRGSRLLTRNRGNAYGRGRKIYSSRNINSLFRNRLKKKNMNIGLRMHMRRSVRTSRKGSVADLIRRPKR